MREIIVSLGGYGDFNMITINSLWLSPEGMNKSEIQNLVIQIKNDNAHTNDTQQAVKQLKKAGFSPIKNINCLVGSNL